MFNRSGDVLVMAGHAHLEYFRRRLPRAVSVTSVVAARKAGAAMAVARVAEHVFRGEGRVAKITTRADWTLALALEAIVRLLAERGG